MNPSLHSSASKSKKSPPGKAIQAKSKSKIQNPLFSMLKKDHRELDRLFSRLRKAIKAEAGVTKGFEELKSFLLSHAKAEELTVYPALIALGEKRGSRVEKKTDNDIGEAKEEHHVAELLLGEISSLSESDPAFKAKVTVLCESVAHHIEEEEGSFSDWARLLREDNGQVAQEYRSRMDALLGKH